MVLLKVMLNNIVWIWVTNGSDSGVKRNTLPFVIISLIMFLFCFFPWLTKTIIYNYNTLIVIFYWSRLKAVFLIRCINKDIMLLVWDHQRHPGYTFGNIVNILKINLRLYGFEGLLMEPSLIITIPVTFFFFL